MDPILTDEQLIDRIAAIITRVNDGELTANYALILISRLLDDNPPID